MTLGQFISPDTLVPDPGMLIDHNRYGYVRTSIETCRDGKAHGSAHIVTGDQIVGQRIAAFSVIVVAIHKSDHATETTNMAISPSRRKRCCASAGSSLEPVICAVRPSA